MPSKARQKKIMEKLNRAQKCSILGPQNLGSGGAQAPGAPLDLHLLPPEQLRLLCRLKQVSLGIYRVLYTFFWPAEFPGYHQCQQESQ